MYIIGGGVSVAEGENGVFGTFSYFVFRHHTMNNKRVEEEDGEMGEFRDKLN